MPSKKGVRGGGDRKEAAKSVAARGGSCSAIVAVLSRRSTGSAGRRAASRPRSAGISRGPAGTRSCWSFARPSGCTARGNPPSARNHAGTYLVEWWRLSMPRPWPRRRPALYGFNGAASIRTRKAARRDAGMVKLDTLQWGRVHKDAEGGAQGRRHGQTRHASNGAASIRTRKAPQHEVDNCSPDRASMGPRP